MNNKRSIEILVGLFVLLGVAALVFLAFRAANLTSVSTSKGYQVQARFDNIGGLKPRAAVRSAGVLVGRVKSIKLDQATYQGLVTMEISSSVKFPKDSTAKILTSGLLGDQYIGIEAGADDSKVLAANDVISQTQSAMVLENLIGQLIFNKAADAGNNNADNGGDHEEK